MQICRNPRDERFNFTILHHMAGQALATLDGSMDTQTEDLAEFARTFA